MAARDGFSLLEVLVAIVVLGIVSAMMSFALHGAMVSREQLDAEPARQRDRASEIAVGFATHREHAVAPAEPAAP